MHVETGAANTAVVTASYTQALVPWLHCTAGPITHLYLLASLRLLRLSIRALQPAILPMHTLHCPFHLPFCCTTGSGAGVGSQLCVWSVMVLPDGTMVSGDSTGTLQFWDGQHGTLLQAFSQHKADILAVAASKDGNIVFATGIDVQVSRMLPPTLLTTASIWAVVLHPLEGSGCKSSNYDAT